FYSQIFVTSKSTKQNTVHIRLCNQTDDITLNPKEHMQSETFFIKLDKEATSEASFATELRAATKPINKKPPVLRGFIMSFYYNDNYITQDIFDKQIREIEKQ